MSYYLSTGATERVKVRDRRLSTTDPAAFAAKQAEVARAASAPARRTAIMLAVGGAAALGLVLYLKKRRKKAAGSAA